MKTARYRLLWLTFVLGAILAVLGASYAPLASAAPDWRASAYDVAWQDAANPDGDGAVGLDDPAPTQPGNPPLVTDPIPVDPNILLWQSLLGVIASVVTSAVARVFPGPGDDDKLKRAITFAVVALLVGVLDTMVRGVFNPTNYIASVLTIATAAVAFYRAWFKTSTLSARMEGRPLVH